VQLITGGPDASGEMFRRANAAPPGNGPFCVDPHVEAQPVITAETLADRRNVERRHAPVDRFASNFTPRVVPPVELGADGIPSGA
jgi:hypothetical protein